MSAWIVSRDHLDLLLTAAVAWELAAPDDTDRLGRMLWTQNLASVAYRYPADRDGDSPSDVRDRRAATYRFRRYPGRIDPQVVATAADSFTYQSCEHPGWVASPARDWVARLHADATARIPAYLAEHGPVDPRRQARDERGWYVLIDEHHTERLRCRGQLPRVLFNRANIGFCER